MTIATIINILPIICGECPEMKLIADLNMFFNFDHNVFLFDSPDDINRFIYAEGPMQPPQSVYVLTDANNNINPEESLKEVRGKNTFMIVVPVDTKYERIFQFSRRLALIQRLKIDLKIGFFFNRFVEIDDLRILFQRCKRHLLANVFAAVHAYPKGISTPIHGSRLNIFTFNPFGNMDVINVTGSNTYDNLFSTIKPNFHQHEFRIGQLYELSLDKHLWPNVFGLMNGTFRIVKKSSDVVLFSNSTDITLTQYTQDDSGIRSVYPVTTQHRLIIVPAASPYPEFSAYLRTVLSDKFFGYSLVVIAVAVLLLTVSRYFKQMRLSFFESVVDVGNLLMNDNAKIKYRQLSHAEIFLIVPLTFVGFVVTNGILSNLKSHLTRPVLQPQIKTLEEIHNYRLQIYTYSEEWKKELLKLLANESKHTDWNDKVVVLEGAAFREHISHLNVSSSYFLHDEFANMVFRAQERLGVKVYHNPKIYISAFFYTYVVNKNFLFNDRLDEILHWTRNAGLLNLWWREAHVKLQQKLVNENLHSLKNVNKTTVRTFEFPMFVVYGWITSILVLVIEIIWNRKSVLQAARTQ